MKIECVKEKIHNAISKAEKVTSKNLTLPVLSCLLLETDKNVLKIKATNLDLGIEIKIPVKVEEAGTVAIPATILNSFLSNLEDDKSLIIETAEENLSVRSANTSSIIKTYSKDDFPTIPVMDGGKSVKIGARDLIRGLRSVVYSSSISTVKPELASVYVYTEEESMVFVATDSFRLAEKKIKIKKGTEIAGILLPYRNVTDIIRIFDDIDDEIEIKINKNQLSIYYDGLYVVSRVIDGVFPDYKQIIPKEQKTQVIILKQDLINSLKISNIFSDNFHQVNIKVVPGNKIFQIKTKNLDVGENINKLDATTEGEEVDINFNHKYIIDCLQSVESDSVSLSFNGMTKPMIIKGVSDRSFTYLVMPMNR